MNNLIFIYNFLNHLVNIYFYKISKQFYLIFTITYFDIFLTNKKILVLKFIFIIFYIFFSFPFILDIAIKEF